MSSHYEALLNYDIPQVRQSYGLAEVARYALSIGMGQDPLDTRQLDYLAAGSAPVAMPAIVNVLGHPGFWLGNPDTGVDALRLVHGEQGFTLHRPVPLEATILAKTRVTDIVDKGEGRGALLYLEKKITECDSGDIIATCNGTIFLRGNGGIGGPPGASRRPHRVPETAPMHSFDTTTRPEQALLYRWNGDDNPLHFDPETARKAGFERPILHGLCSFGCVAHALLAQLCDYDANRFGQMQARFTAHVFPGETLRTQMWPDGSFQTWAVERDTLVIGNGLFRFREGINV